MHVLFFVIESDPEPCLNVDSPPTLDWLDIKLIQLLPLDEERLGRLHAVRGEIVHLSPSRAHLKIRRQLHPGPRSNKCTEDKQIFRSVPNSSHRLFLSGSNTYLDC
jgi:hypothetical protein